MPNNAPWMDVARGELGTREAPGAADNPRVLAYYAEAGHPEIQDDATAWCAAFVGACLKRSGLPHSGSLAARSYLNYGRKLDRPEPGCIVVFWRGSPTSWQGHVAFYAGDAGDRVRVLGGNQSNAVTEASYPRSQVLGYRWPGPTISASGLSEDAIKAAQARLKALRYPVGLIDGEIGTMTRMALRAYQETAGLPVTGSMDDATLASLKRPDAPPMPISETRAKATAADVAAAGSTTVKTANVGEVVAAAGTAAAAGNALADAGAAFTEAGKVVTTVETGRGLGTKAIDLLTWMATPRGAAVALSVAVCIGTWVLIRHIKARRVAAHREGRQV